MFSKKSRFKDMHRIFLIKVRTNNCKIIKNLFNENLVLIFVLLAKSVGNVAYSSSLRVIE